MPLSINQILAALFLLLLFGGLFLFYRLINEIIPTLRQLRRTIREMEQTIRNSQEVLYNVKSITANLDQQVEELNDVVAATRGIVMQVHNVTTMVSKPVTGLRSILAGIGYGVKHLVKRNNSYDDYYQEEE
jgi:uncharacterized protein YoxC